jgi:anti-sigma factor RsiW
MKLHTPITEADLHAYVDNQLAPARRHEVEDHLRIHPEAATQVEEYRRLNDAVHELYTPILDEPLPAQLMVRPPGHRRLLRVAAVTLWLAIGGVIGWLLRPPDTVMLTADGPVRMHLVQPAAFAHYVYAAEVRHPVEVPAQEEKHLVTWLSKRLHTDIKAPNLSAQGFELVGGRLLPSTDRMAAQFMYQRADGVRVTLYVRHGAWDNETTAFRYDRRGNIGVFYWIDGPLGYALAGELSKAQLLRLSEQVYGQL